MAFGSVQAGLAGLLVVVALIGVGVLLINKFEEGGRNSDHGQ